MSMRERKTERERGTCRRWKWRECLEMHVDEREKYGVRTYDGGALNKAFFSQHFGNVTF